MEVLHDVKYLTIKQKLQRRTLMEETNPYSAPSSDLHEGDGDNYDLQPPRAVSPGNGIKWLSDGFTLLKQDLGTWVLTMIIGFVIMIILSIIPLINIIVGLTTYAWVGGLMLGCKAQNDGKKFEINYLFKGFSTNFWSLVLTYVIVMIISLVVMFLTLGSMFSQIFMASFSGQPPSPDMFSIEGFVLPVLIAMAILIPVMMAAWFAPILIVVNNLGAIQAMTQSFKGCIKNVIPFLLYGILGFVIVLVAMIPFGLGLLIAVPLFYTSTFCAYKDIFLKQDS